MKKANIVLMAIFLAGIWLAGCSNANQERTNDSVSSDQEIGEALSNRVLKDSNTYVTIQDTCMLTIYYPKYSKIDLVCEKMPDKSEDSVILVCAAAYTAEYLDHFEHTNIIGNHVSGGELYRGAAPKNLKKGDKACYRGAFSFYDGKPHFAHDNWNEDFQLAAEKGGCGFAQNMMIHQGGIVDHSRENEDSDIFRALCLINGRVAVADSKEYIPFRDFIQNLINAGATEAIYLDMGGWKHSWYRDGNGEAIDLFPNPTKFGTNWITFYR